MRELEGENGDEDLIRLAFGKPPSPMGKVAERSEVG